ncbi:hypothetical protein [Deinococcus aluminii]|uniref:Uncharacterized protein n=1 Tax=Deinococcus aluminii TaxID=1656885 RepID=A0ABP9XHN0_9DEIO
MRDLLLHPEKYVGVEQKLEAGGRRTKVAERRAPAVPPNPAEAELPTLPEDPDERVKAAEQRLSLFRIWPLLTSEDRDNVEHAVRTGALPLPALLTLLVRTVGENKVDIADKVRALALRGLEDE